MVYRIHIPPCSAGCDCGVSLTRRRSDAAMLAAERALYDAIASYAGLDTAWGRAAMDQLHAIDPHQGGTVIIGSTGLVLFFTPSHA